MRRGIFRKMCGLLGALFLSLVVLSTGAWGVLALWFFDDASAALRGTLAAAFALVTCATLAALLSGRWRRRALVVFAASLTLLLVCWFRLSPTNDRNWQSEVAVLSYATFAGEHVTVHNIRNFDYRTENDFTVGYYDKTFDLRQLDSVDLVAVYWMGPKIAHIFLSFGFAGRDYLAISIEARKLAGEGFSTLKGFFRQYELYFVVADERDVIRVRTNYRKNPPEETHLYRVHGNPADARRLFVAYLDQINALRNRPEFYNSLTTNCTTNIWMLSRVNPDHLPFSWKILVSGYLPEYLHQMDRLDTSVPFAQLQRRSIINTRAQAADQAADFSQRIREPLP
jgi:hypothetical protein